MLTHRTPCGVGQVESYKWALELPARLFCAIIVRENLFICSQRFGKINFRPISATNIAILELGPLSSAAGT